MADVASTMLRIAAWLGLLFGWLAGGMLLDDHGMGGVGMVLGAVGGVTQWAALTVLCEVYERVRVRG